MKFTLLFLTCLLYTSVTFGQSVSELTIFSNTGKRFFVILNGERQNEKAQTNIKITGLEEEWYNCRVIAEDKSFNLEKNISVTPGMETTYRIKGKRKRFKLKFYTVNDTGIESEASDQFSMDYYNPNKPQPKGNAGNAGNGMITITNNGETGSPQEGNLYEDQEMTMTFAAGQGCGTNDAEVAYIAGQVLEADFSDDKMAIALKTAKEKCMTIAQIKTIANALDFSESKMTFVKACYLNCLEQKDYIKLKSIFDFADDKAAFQAFVDSK